ncbi:T9SS type A sorting domain-containing protein [Fibrella aquatilis]|uniref:T9SS type A sorting domain-containing protein n=1 Tax=Fibrella aquatilis TaxID=2817059 RepID=A0A939G646_9BACT|nr:T9SS type A sorting domain-containing protein [Fibrella aquatilis]MBO0931730.1 T9SS type A sorting domain-containing protein [Fibrella aquatilis]
MHAGTYILECQASAPAVTLERTSTFFLQTPLSLTLSPVSKVVYENYSPHLVLNTTINGPLSYTIATPTGDKAYVTDFPLVTGPATIPVPITQSGNYSLVGVANQCGPGQASGVASVTILPTSNVTIFPRMAAYEGIFCAGQTYLVGLLTTGTFSTGNVFTAYVANAQGQRLRTLPLIILPDKPAANRYVVMPTDLPDSDNYVFQVGSSSPAHLGASLLNDKSSESASLRLRQLSTATLTGAVSVFKNDSARLSVALTGSPPWRLIYPGQTETAMLYNINQSPATFTVKPDSTTDFRLTAVYDLYCGRGNVVGSTLITVSVLLATEPALPLQVRAWPNPTAGGLQIEGEMAGQGDVAFTLHTELGKLILTSVGGVQQGKLNHRMDLSQQPDGLYILTAEQDGRLSQFKVLKQ